MENQKSVVNPMTAEQYFALRSELVRLRTFVAVILFICMNVGIVLIVIGKSLGDSNVIIAGVVMVFPPLFLYILYRKKTRNALDDLRIDYSTGKSFEHSAIKLGLLEEKIKEPRFTPGACECQ